MKTVGLSSVNIPKIEVLWINFVMNKFEYFVACINHPPKQQYVVECLYSAIASDIDYIHSLPGDHIIIVADDFNSLRASSLAVSLASLS